MKKIFCSLPFTKIFLGPDGGIRTCCASTQDLGSLKDNTIEEILQNDNARTVRQQFINNEWPEQCSKFCKDVASTINIDATEMKYHEDIYTSAIEQGPSFFSLRTTDLRWSNLCNLTCNYCDPYYSSKWAQIKGVKINDNVMDNTESLLQYVDESLKKSPLDVVQLLGGEPLLQKQNVRLLEILKDYPNILVSISTNMSTPLESNKVAQLLLEHPNTHWHISMDNIGDRLEYVRDGASWEILNNNIKYLMEHTQRVWIWPIYSIYSATNLMELYDWASENKIGNIYWQVVSPGGPYPIYAKNLNKTLKLKAIKEIESVIEKYGGFYDMSRLASYKETMLVKYLDRTDLLDYKQYHLDLETNVLKNKKHSFAELWPDL